MATTEGTRAFEEYGFTNDVSHLERVRAFRDAAVADGWSIEPTYGTHEPVDRAAKLYKGGFDMMVLTRDNRDKKYKYAVEATINIWAPDGLAILIPESYNWQAIRDGVHVCWNCKERVDKTHQYSFAGRCCEACLPEMRKKHEYPGWSN